MTTGQRTGSAVFHRRPSESYPVFVRAEDCYFWDADGKQYLDLSSGMAWAGSLGQGRDDIAAVLAKQAGRLTFIHNAWASTDQQELFADRLTALAPPGVNRATFTSGGSEANELALRISRQYHLSRGESDRWKIISLEHSYHGATVGALSMTGKVHVNDMVTADYGPYLLDLPKIAAPIRYRGRFSELPADEVGRAAADELARSIEKEGPETVSAFFVEPVMGNAGMTVLPDDYLRLVRKVCDEYGVLLVADEVMTGAGRTGAFLCSEHYSVTPDLTIMAKALSGGYAPLGAVLIHDKVAEAIVDAGRRLDHVHTYSGHPVACAVGTKVLEILQQERLFDVVREQGSVLRSLLRDRLSELGCIGDVRGMGLANGVEYVQDREACVAYPASTLVAESIWEGMLKRGFILPTQRYLGSELIGDFSIFAPPFTITKGQLEDAVDALGETIEGASASW